MPVKAQRVTDEELGTLPKGQESTGISMLFVPDATFRLLSDEAAKRNMTVAQLLATALSVYLGRNESREAPVEKPPRKALTLKGYK